jgi:phospholipid/cholesterol/gamma-HCH transport system ATP-binding protein
MDMYASGPLLELNKAIPSFDESGLPPVPFSMKLMPGDCMVVEARDIGHATMFADLCCGLVRWRMVPCGLMGLDWADLGDRELNALRGRYRACDAPGKLARICAGASGNCTAAVAPYNPSD